MSAHLLVVAMLSSCGGSAVPGATSPAERDELITQVVITPTESERDGGGKEVVIDEENGVSTWVKSTAFAAGGWQKNDDQSPPRYLVSFRSRDGEVARYFLGTAKEESVEYRCFGLCARWWVAPSDKDGQQDPLRYRPLEDAVWHPMARQWYFFSK